MPTRDGDVAPPDEAGAGLAGDPDALLAVEEGASTLEAWLKPQAATAIDAKSTKRGKPDLFMVTALSSRAQSCRHVDGNIRVYRPERGTN